MRHVAAVVNPAAGRKRALTVWRRVESELERRGFTAETMVSAEPGHAAELARRAVQSGVPIVLAVGGDGTVHQVVNGLWNGSEIAPGVALGIVPAGTGMDLARSLRLRRGPLAAANRIVRGRSRMVDIGLAESDQQRLFVNFAETGMGATIVARESEAALGLPGRLSYVLAAVDTVRRQANIPVSVVLDGRPVYNGPVVSVVVANGRYLGGGMKIAPSASMEDGLLDVLILGNLSRGEILGNIWKIYPGIHLTHPKVAWLRGRSVRVNPRGPSSLDLDGELYGGGECQFSTCSGALPVLL